MHNEKPAIKSQ